MYGKAKRRGISWARALACKWLVEDLGMLTVQVARMLRISQPAVSQCVVRGRHLDRELGERLEGKSPEEGNL